MTQAEKFLRGIMKVLSLEVEIDDNAADLSKLTETDHDWIGSELTKMGYIVRKTPYQDGFEFETGGEKFILYTK